MPRGACAGAPAARSPAIPARARQPPSPSMPPAALPLYAPPSPPPASPPAPVSASGCACAAGGRPPLLCGASAGPARRRLPYGSLAPPPKGACALGPARAHSRG